MLSYDSTATGQPDAGHWTRPYGPLCFADFNRYPLTATHSFSEFCVSSQIESAGGLGNPQAHLSVEFESRPRGEKREWRLFLRHCIPALRARSILYTCYFCISEGLIPCSTNLLSQLVILRIKLSLFKLLCGFFS